MQPVGIEQCQLLSHYSEQNHMGRFNSIGYPEKPQSAICYQLNRIKDQITQKLIPVYKIFSKITRTKNDRYLLKLQFWNINIWEVFIF